MKKEKKFKLNADQRQTAELFKRAIEEYALSGNYGTFCGFNEEYDKDNYRLSAEISNGDYRALIIYRPLYFLENNFFDIKFKFGTEKEYTIYDVFNLLDIDDFTQYYYSSNILNEEEIKKYVLNLLELIKKYDYDLKKAAQPDKLVRLEENRQADLKMSYSKNYQPDDEPSIFDFDITHPIFSFASNTDSSEKIFKKLEKAESKGKIGTLYEKRLLEYMRRGNTYENTEKAENEKNAKSYIVKSVLFDLLLFVLSLSIVVLIIWVIKSAIYSGAVVPKSYLSLGFVNLPISSNQLIYGLLASICLAVLIHRIFGKRLFKLIFSKDEEVHSLFNLNADVASGKTKKQKILTGIETVIAVVLCVGGVALAAMDGIGFYDDYVKYAGSSVFPVSVKYEDVVLYRIDGEYDDDYNFNELENGYAISDKDGVYYLIGNAKIGGETDSKIKKIAAEYNKKIVHIRSVEEIENENFRN